MLPTSAKDIFIMKLIQNQTHDADKYYELLKGYIERVIATINSVKPSSEQKKLYKGSATDEEMIKYQVIASEFGFTDKQIQDAYPNMSTPYELTVIQEYKKSVETISEILQTKELNLPLIVRSSKIYPNIQKVAH
jgi:hypothetical protein